MKYYKNQKNNLFEDPVIENHIGLVEITKEEFDNQLIVNNTPNIEELRAIRENEVKIHFCNLINDGFEYNGNWFACKRHQQDDLLKLISALNFSENNQGTYRCYSITDGVKDVVKTSKIFAKDELINIFNQGSIFIQNEIGNERAILDEIKDFSFQQLRDFKIKTRKANK